MVDLVRRTVDQSRVLVLREDGMWWCLDEGEPPKTWNKATLAEIAMAERFAKIREAMAKIVVFEGVDAGMILLSDASPTHYDQEAKCQAYDRENVSELGDALVSVAKLADVTV